MLGMHIEVVASDFSCLCFLLDSSSLCNLIFILHFLPHKFWLYCTFSHFGIYILAGKNCWNYCREEDGDCGERCFCFLPLEFLLYVKAVFICLWRQGGSRNGCFHRVTVLPNTHKVNLFFFWECLMEEITLPLTEQKSWRNFFPLVGSVLFLSFLSPAVYSV